MVDNKLTISSGFINEMTIYSRGINDGYGVYVIFTCNRGNICNINCGTNSCNNITSYNNIRL